MYLKYVVYRLRSQYVPKAEAVKVEDANGVCGTSPPFVLDGFVVVQPESIQYISKIYSV